MRPKNAILIRASTTYTIKKTNNQSNIFLLFIVSIYAQKYGHIDSGKTLLYDCTKNM